MKAYIRVDFPVPIHVGELSERKYDDCNRIIAVLKSQDITCSLSEAYYLWKNYSDNTYSASWLCMPGLDDSLLKLLLNYYKFEN